MRQVISSGSVKAISLDRDAVLKKLQDIAREASLVFPKIVEVRLLALLQGGRKQGLAMRMY